MRVEKTALSPPPFPSVLRTKNLQDSLLLQLLLSAWYQSHPYICEVSSLPQSRARIASGAEIFISHHQLRESGEQPRFVWRSGLQT